MMQSTNRDTNRTRSISGDTKHVDHYIHEACKKFSERAESALILVRAISRLLVEEGICTTKEAETESHRRAILDGLTWINFGDDEICVVKKGYSFFGTQLDPRKLTLKHFRKEWNVHVT